MKITIRIIIGLLIISFISVATYYTLSLVLPKQGASQQHALAAQTPEAVIKAYSAVNDASQSSYTVSPQPALQPMQVNPTDNSYAVTINPTHAVQYNQNDTSATKNNESVIKTAESFFNGHGFIKGIDTSYFNVRYVTYKGQQTVCQIIDNPAKAKLGAYYSIACSNNTAVTTQKGDIDTLLELYPRHAQLNPRVVQQSTSTSGDKTLTQLQVQTDVDSKNTELFYITKSSKTLFLGNIDWQTVNGTLSRTESTELKASLKDPQYSSMLSVLLEK